MLIGGPGDDTFIIDSISDTVNENLNNGTDLIIASVSYTLPINVEKITLTGSSNIDATGNDLDNTLIGNSSNNTLNGGNGNDLLIGGPGDDTFIIDSISDTVNENFNNGTDLIIASVSYTLPINVEKITLTGSSNIDATGNDLDNTFKGNKGNNKINGGLGTDIVIFESLFNDYSLSLSDGNVVIEDDRSGYSNGRKTLEDIEIAEFSDLTKTITELLNNLHTITEHNYGAAQLNFLETNATQKIDATSVTSLFGKLSELNSTYSSTMINGLGNEALIISDTSINASLLNTLDENTTGNIDASTGTSLTGTASEINNAFESSGIDGLGDEALIISDTSINASLLNILDENTTGNIDASTGTSLTGTASEINNAFESSGIDGLGDEALIISDTSINASLLNILDENTTGNIDASTGTSLTGTASEINNAFESSGIDGLGDEALIISDTSINASLLNTLDENTTGNIDASTGTSLTGTASEINKAFESSGIDGLGDEALIISDTSINASLLNTLDENTTGNIDASTLKILQGNGADALKAFNSKGISELTFDASNYLASHKDLLDTFGSNTTAAKSHYFAKGVTEGRNFDDFDESSYLASHKDLLKAFGSNTTFGS